MQQKYLSTRHSVAAGAVFLGIAAAGLLGVVSFDRPIVLDAQEAQVVDAGGSIGNNPAFVSDPDVTHIATPDPVYSIYMSQCVVGTPSFRDSLVDLIDSTPLNAVVIDIKDYSGTIGFEAQDPRFADATLVSCGARDMKAFIKRLHEQGIYVIGRITVFQDPFYTKAFPEQAVQSISHPGQPWEDYKGLAFVDVSSKPYWEYVTQLSKEAYAIGFDELNYDYVRYPSDGPMKDAQFVNNNKAEALEKFFKYLHENVHPIGVKMSADLFGYTTVLTDDLGIGQQLERALPYFDYVAPMVYPSHYNKGFEGLANPNSDPYKVVYASMSAAVKRTIARETTVHTLDGAPIMKDETVPAYTDASGAFIATTTKQVATGEYTKPVYDKGKLRPWLQDFDYGKEYTKADIAAQIKAVQDAGLTSWFFWDPANRYDSLSQYLKNL